MKKIVKENLNEFKRTRKTGLSSNTDIGVIKQQKKVIEDWLKENDPDADFEIDDQLLVTVHGDLYFEDIDPNLTEMPIPGLVVESSLEIVDANIVKLPDYLKVGKNLMIKSTSIESLPESLWEKQGEEYIFNGGYLALLETNITELPDLLTINGDFELTFNYDLNKLPSILKVNGNFDFYENGTDDLPEDLYICGKFKNKYD